MVKPAQPDRLVQGDRRDLLVILVQPDRKVQKAIPVRRARRARWVHRGRLVKPAQPGRWGRRDHRDRLVKPAQPGQLVQWDRRGRLAIPAQPDRKVQKGIPVRRVRRGRRGQKAIPVQRVP